jgi:CDP-diacylglycerol--inositol 3-phosphatidyltransferase
MNPVYLYYPNLIGYIRVISTIWAFYFAFSSPIAAGILYSFGSALDVVDGMLARKFNQCSRFGAVLDMLTDRMATSVLLVVLGHFYETYWGVFISLFVLDIVSHWYHVYAKLIQSKTSHKGSLNPLISFYYTYPYALFAFCLGNELFFIVLYMLAWPTYLSTFGSIVLKLLLLLSAPVCFLKQVINVIQLRQSIEEIVEFDHPSTGKK